MKYNENEKYAMRVDHMPSGRTYQSDFDKYSQSNFDEIVDFIRKVTSKGGWMKWESKGEIVFFNSKILRNSAVSLVSQSKFEDELPF